MTIAETKIKILYLVLTRDSRKINDKIPQTDKGFMDYVNQGTFSETNIKFIQDFKKTIDPLKTKKQLIEYIKGNIKGTNLFSPSMYASCFSEKTLNKNYVVTKGSPTLEINSRVCCYVMGDSNPIIKTYGDSKPIIEIRDNSKPEIFIYDNSDPFLSYFSESNVSISSWNDYTPTCCHGYTESQSLTKDGSIPKRYVLRMVKVKRKSVEVKQFLRRRKKT